MNILSTFMDLEKFNDIAVTEPSDFIKNILICVPKINEERHEERESNPTESDMDMYWKQAECLEFKRETQYSYDGTTEFCHVDKDSSSDKTPSLVKSDQ